MDDAIERNKTTAQAFYDLMFNQCRPAEAVERFVGKACVQHNPSSSGVGGIASAGPRTARVANASSSARADGPHATCRYADAFQQSVGPLGCPIA